MFDLQDRVATAVAATGVPGASVALFHDGQVISAAAGVADVEGNGATVDHQFPIMSITKPMTAMLAHRAIDEGRMGLDDLVVSVLPTFRLADPDVLDQLTVRHLLANTNGLAPYRFADEGEGDDAVQRFAASFGEEETAFAPGSRFSYTNAGYNILGAVVEHVSGATFEELLQARILGPYGLAATGTTWPPQRPITQFWLEGEEHEPEEWWRMRSGGPCGAGTVYATAADVSRFGARAAIDCPALSDTQVEVPGSYVESWGMGWATFGWGAGVVGWDGFAPAGRMYLRVMPEHGAALTILTNSQYGRRVYRELVPALFQDVFGIVPAPEAPPPLPVAAFDRSSIVGTYMAGAAVATVVESPEGLEMSDHMGGHWTAVDAGDGRFVAVEPDIDYPEQCFSNGTMDYFYSVWTKVSD